MKLATVLSTMLMGSALFAQSDNDQPRPASSPKVSFISPLNNSTVSGTVWVALRVFAPDGVRFVQLSTSENGCEFGVFRRPPYRTRWNTINTRNGWVTLKASLTDLRGRVTRAEIRVRVVNPAPPHLPQ
jgi:hypothetical protein